jgi:hypothetical protein
MFNKLEEESAVLRQDLEGLQVDLGRLMEKHEVAGEVFDEKYELRKPDEYFEDSDDGNARVPDDGPAVPDVQMLQASPLYALPAYRECGPGNSYESNYGLLTEPC